MAKHKQDPERREKGTGSPVKRKRKGGVVYLCRWRGPWGEKFAPGSWPTKQKAERIISRVEDWVAEGLALDAAIAKATGRPERAGKGPDELTFGELTTRYLDALEREHKRTPENMVRERSRANTILETPLASMNGATVDEAAAARWAGELRQTRAVGTVNRSIALASKVWRYGKTYKWTRTGANPFREIDRDPERARDKGETLTPAEVETLAGLVDPDFAWLTVAAFQSVARPKELYALEWRDVHLDGSGGYLQVRPETEKTRRGRKVPITPRLAVVLREILGGNVHPMPTRRVFLRASNGRPWTARAVSDRWQRLKAKLTDKHIPYERRVGLLFYDLRAAGITRMLGAGLAPPVVQKIAGHKHLATTMRYCGNLAAEQKAAAPAMAAALAG